MTAQQKEQIEKNLKPNEVAVDTQSKQTGTDEQGYPTFETVFEKAPNNYKLVRLIEPWNGAILEDLDYKEPTNEQNTEENLNS